MVTQRVEDLPQIPTPDEVEEAVFAALDQLDPVEESDGGFVVHDEASADWALRKLARVLAKAAEVTVLAERQRHAILASVQAYLDPIDEWAGEQIDRLAKDAEFFESLLLTFHRNVLAEDPRAKTIKLPHGTLSSRKLPDRWEFDEPTFIKWASENADELLRTKIEIYRAEAKKALSVATTGEVVWGGEIVPGVTVTTGERDFTVWTEES